MPIRTPAETSCGYSVPLHSEAGLTSSPAIVAGRGKAYIEAHAKEIAAALLNTDESIKAMAPRLGVSLTHLSGVYRANTTPKQRREAKYRKWLKARQKEQDSASITQSSEALCDTSPVVTESVGRMRAREFIEALDRQFAPDPETWA